MLTLYYKPTCPYCQRVLQEAEALGVSFDLKNIVADDTIATELIEKGGKRQVPYLIDPEKGQAMYESQDIIEYINEHYGRGTAPGEGKIRVHKSNSGSCDVCE